MADGQAVDRDLGLVVEQQGERLVGKHVRPQVGMIVSMSGQGIDRRKDSGRSDPSRGGVGCIVRVNENWTADVEWHATGQTRQGYSCGCVARGGKTRAFHLAVVPNNAILPSYLRGKGQGAAPPRQQYHQANGGNNAENMGGVGAYDGGGGSGEYSKSHMGSRAGNGAAIGGSYHGSGATGRVVQGGGGSGRHEGFSGDVPQNLKGGSRGGSVREGSSGMGHFAEREGYMVPMELPGLQLESQRVPYVLPSQARA